MVARSVTAPVGTPPDQKNASIDPSRMRLHRLADAQPTLGDVVVGVEAGDLQQPQRDHLGAGAGRADRHGLVAQVLEPLDAAVGLDDDLRDVRVEGRERADLQRVVERLLPGDRVDRAVGEREGDVRVAVGDEQQVVDRRGGGLGRGRRVGHRIAQDVGEPAAVDLVDAAGAARGDRQPVVITRRVVGRTAQPQDRQQHRHRQQPPHGRGVPGAAGRETTRRPAARAACASRRPPARR